MHGRVCLLIALAIAFFLFLAGLAAPDRALADGTSYCRVTGMTVMRDGSLDICGDYEHGDPLAGPGGWTDVTLTIWDSSGHGLDVRFEPQDLGPGVLQHFDVRLPGAVDGFSRSDLRDGDWCGGEWSGLDALGNLVFVSGAGISGTQAAYPFLVTSADVGTTLTWHARFTHQFGDVLWNLSDMWGHAALVHQPWPYENPYPDPLRSGSPTDSPADMRPVVVCSRATTPTGEAASPATPSRLSGSLFFDCWMPRQAGEQGRPPPVSALTFSA